MDSIVDALVFVAVHCRFEGWLLNVECTLPEEKVPQLRLFAEKLTQKTREKVPHGTTIWYDSIIDTGELKWQDELNEKNKQFFDACDGILLNYTWDEENLVNSVETVGGSATEMAKIFVGLDVFGRGQVAGFQSNQVCAEVDFRYYLQLSLNIFFRLLTKFVCTNSSRWESSHLVGPSKRYHDWTSTSTPNVERILLTDILSIATIGSGLCCGQHSTPYHTQSFHFIRIFVWALENSAIEMESLDVQQEAG